MILSSLPFSKSKDEFSFLQIAVNGAHFATFPHRVNMHNIKYLEIVKAIAIDQVSIYNQVREYIIEK